MCRHSRQQHPAGILCRLGACAHRLLCFVQDDMACCGRLVEGCYEKLQVQAGELGVQLQGSDAGARARHLQATQQQ